MIYWYYICDSNNQRRVLCNIKYKKIRFQADYLVPVYNIKNNILFLSEYNNGVHWVRLWAVSAQQNAESKSMLESIDAELQEYTNAIAENTDETKLAKLQHGEDIMTKLATQARDTVWHKKPEPQLVSKIRGDFARSQLSANVSKALYLEGVSYIR